MSRAIPVPKIDARTEDDLLLRLREMAPHYTREWPARDEDDPGVGLLRIFSFIAGGVIGSLNRAPERNFLAFLDMLGIRLLPATPARAPVRFLVAQGTDDEFLVAKGTQISAPAAEDRPEMPFVTTEELTVIPAALTALVAVDPARDHIYKPPPGFLALELAATELPTMNVLAFSSAGSKTLQLDLPEQLKEGDFIKVEPPPEPSGPAVGCLPAAAQSGSRASEYLVVAEVKGQIVTLTAPLARDYAEGTVVSKVTRFEVFEGKNFQEHVLYLAHAEYFDIKSEARIELFVQHAVGSPQGLQALDIRWEYFGVTEQATEDGWQPFEVELDATGGFSRDGRLILGKPPGEIKETEVNGNKSRWVRARLAGPIPATPPRPLPRIDSVALAVSSAAEGIAADQAFNNDTPLTVNLEFNPFGREPRLFDRFYLASGEAFSKPGAEVTLQFNLDFTDLLAAPAAVFQTGMIRAFAHGAAGKLLEFRINPLTSAPDVKDHKTPTATRISAGSRPAVVNNVNGLIGVFVRADDGRVYLHYVPSVVEATWQWIDLRNLAASGAPAFDQPAHDPAAVDNNGLWQVYIVANGQVFRTAVTPTSPTAQVAWTQLDGAAPSVASSPFAVLVRPKGLTGPPNLSWVFVTDADGRTWLHNGGAWVDVTPKGDDGSTPLEGFTAARYARPYAVPFNDADDDPQARVFVRNRNNELVVFDTAGGGEKNLGTPEGVVLDSNPHALGTPHEERVYVRASDSRLWELDVNAEQWTLHPNPSDFSLAGDPFALAYQAGPSQQTDFVSVLSTTNKNSLVEFRVRGEDIREGALRAGPREILLLEDPLLPADQAFFIQVTDGPGKDSDEDAVRLVESRQGKFAVLAQPLSVPPTEETEYSVFRVKEQDAVIAPAEEEEEEEEEEGEDVEGGGGGDGEEEEEEEEEEQPDAPANKVRLKAGTTAGDGDFIFVRGQLREIEDVDSSNTATVTPDWETQPEPGDDYHILELISSGNTAEEGSAVRLVLEDTDGTGVDGMYNGLFIDIISGIGSSEGSRVITNYVAATATVVLSDGYNNPPVKGSGYRIFVGGLPEVWHVYSDPDQTPLRPQLSWEYWNGTGWVNLRVDDGTENFLVPGEVTFRLPQNIAPTEVAGQENYWIRARIVGGDYGREQFILENGELKTRKDPIRPPLVRSLSITYAVTELKPPQIALTFNNLSYLDQTAANATPDKHFSPYLTLPDEQRALYFGFDREFAGGPIRLYCAARELAAGERDRPKLAWSYSSENEWRPLAAEDGTDALTKPEFVTWAVPGEFQKRQYFGEALFWVQAKLAEGVWDESPVLSGVFVNTVEAVQARTVLNEILGSSTGAKNERFRFTQLPVLEGEEVRLREALTEDDRAQLLAEDGEGAVLDVLDQEGRVLETWVRWKEVLEFFDSGPRSRHYRLDRASGELEFGDNVRGRIPQAGGDNIRVFSYQAGGGAAGNVGAGQINTPVTAVAGVESVINPVPAGGGSEAATAEEMLEIGPAQLSNRGRAVTPEDFERLAREASREVRKVRCLPNRNATGRHEVGWVSLYVVPDSDEDAPLPSLELRRAVRRFLAARSDLALVAQDHLFVGGPGYVRVDVEVTVYARSFDVVGTAERKVRESLKQFLHPLTGGPEGEGWDFGRDLAASDLYLLLEELAEVDHVEQLVLRHDGAESGERVEVGGDALLAGGTHTVNMKVANGE